MQGEAAYAELCEKHGLRKPGDSKQIVMRFIDGEWVREEEAHPKESPEKENYSSDHQQTV